MEKNKLSFRINTRIITLLQGIIILTTISCVTGQSIKKPTTAIELVNMNVLYIGLDNPVKIATWVGEPSELEVSIDNGTISGSNGEYVIRPKEIGNAVITVKCKGNEIQKSNFRVKSGIEISAVLYSETTVFDCRRGGEISKKDLLKASGIKVVAENSDFDVKFEIIEFTLSALINDSINEAISHCNNFTDKQRAIIGKAKANSKVYIENICAKLKDGSTRYLGSMMFNISED